MKKLLKLLLAVVVVVVVIGVFAGGKKGAESTDSASTQHAGAGADGKAVAQSNGPSGVSTTTAASGVSGGPSPLPSIFTGSASDVSAENWPKVAEVTLAQSEDEKRYLAGRICLDETECYGAKQFRRFIFQRYPDIAKVAYRASRDVAPNRDMLELRKENFFQALYFAKQIQLANGQSLYDFLKACSKGLTPLDAAEIGYDENTQASYFDLQYFPTLRRIDTGEATELQILFERRGDRLIARSPFFTTNALRYPDFLQRHNVTCWNNHATAR